MWAKKVYDVYMAGKVDAYSDRLSLHPFDVYRDVAAARFLAYTPLPVFYKHRVWQTLELKTRQAAYDLAIPALRAQCEAEGYDPGKAFPEPEGMEAYRRAHPTPPVDLFMPTAPEPIDPSQFEILPI
jgi:hypothetical protein